MRHKWKCDFLTCDIFILWQEWAVPNFCASIHYHIPDLWTPVQLKTQFDCHLCTLHSTLLWDPVCTKQGVVFLTKLLPEWRSHSPGAFKVCTSLFLITAEFRSESPPTLPPCISLFAHQRTEGCWGTLYFLCLWYKKQNFKNQYVALWLLLAFRLSCTIYSSHSPVGTPPRSPWSGIGLNPAGLIGALPARLFVSHE